MRAHPTRNQQEFDFILRMMSLTLHNSPDRLKITRGQSASDATPGLPVRHFLHPMTRARFTLQHDCRSAGVIPTGAAFQAEGGISRERSE